MESSLVQVSDLIITHPEVTSFRELEELVKAAARAGVLHLSLDIKPEFPDTPREWRFQLEAAFYSVIGDKR